VVCSYALPFFSPLEFHISLRYHFRSIDSWIHDFFAGSSQTIHHNLMTSQISTSTSFFSHYPERAPFSSKPRNKFRDRANCPTVQTFRPTIRDQNSLDIIFLQYNFILYLTRIVQTVNKIWASSFRQQSCGRGVLMEFELFPIWLLLTFYASPILLQIFLFKRKCSKASCSYLRSLWAVSWSLVL
jgi:hypothetical protein